MAIDPTYLKIFQGVASHAFMHELLNLPVDATPEERMSGACYAGRWFEIEQRSHDEMFEILPPLFMRPGMFAFRELKAGNVGSAFFEIKIADRKRWFHGCCDFSDHGAPDAMRAAILLWETGDTSAMSRVQKLDAIWSSSHPTSRGFAGHANPDAWPAADRGKRTILLYQPRVGTVLKLLEDLTDEEIAEKMSCFGASARRDRGA